MPSTYFLHDSPVGESPVSGFSIAYFCGTCGEIWGRIVSSAEWIVEQAPCEHHKGLNVLDYSRVPGSLLAIDESLVGRERVAASLTSFPPSLLRRELHLHLNYAERQLNDE